MSAAYDFTQPGAGDYSIELFNLFTYVDAGGPPKNLHATVEDVAGVRLSHSLVPSRVYNKRADYHGCTVDHMLVLAAAAVGAQGYADEAYTYLKASRALWCDTISGSVHTMLLARRPSRTSLGRFLDFSHDCATYIPLPGVQNTSTFACVCIFQSSCKSGTNKSLDQFPIISELSALPSGKARNRCQFQSRFAYPRVFPPNRNSRLHLRQA